VPGGQPPPRGIGRLRFSPRFRVDFPRRPPDRNLALLAAAVLPGTGRDRLLRLEGEPTLAGYAVVLDDGTPAGHLRLFDEPLLDALNVAVSLVRSPQSLAFLLEAAGGLALERCGAILEESVSEAGPEVA
jgi:hypothetical protein